MPTSHPLPSSIAGCPRLRGEAWPVLRWAREMESMNDKGSRMPWRTAAPQRLPTIQMAIKLLRHRKYGINKVWHLHSACLETLRSHIYSLSWNSSSLILACCSSLWHLASILSQNNTIFLVLTYLPYQHFHSTFSKQKHKKLYKYMYEFTS